MEVIERGVSDVGGVGESANGLEAGEKKCAVWIPTPYGLSSRLGDSGKHCYCTI